MHLNPLNKLSRRERQIMDILLEHKALSAQAIQTALPDPPSYSAVRALLVRLVDKQLVSITQEGARYIYSPAVEEDQVQASAVSRLLRVFFRGSRVNAVNALLDAEGEKLTQHELNEIQRTISRLKSIQETKHD